MKFRSHGDFPNWLFLSVKQVKGLPDGEKLYRKLRQRGYLDEFEVAVLLHPEPGRNINGYVTHVCVFPGDDKETCEMMRRIQDKWITILPPGPEHYVNKGAKPNRS